MHAGEKADPAVGLGARIGQQVADGDLDVEAAQQVRQHGISDAALNQQSDQGAQEAPHRPKQRTGLKGEGGWRSHSVSNVFVSQIRGTWDKCPHHLTWE